jgi:two-component system sensor histidine kinase BaeS
MFRLTIQRKVFLATFALATTLALLLVFVMRWNLGQGFERYTSAAEFARLDWIIRNIESEYAAHGNWDFVRQAPETSWRRFQRPASNTGIGPGGEMPVGAAQPRPALDVPPQQAGGQLPPWQQEGRQPPWERDGRPPPPWATGRQPPPGSDGPPPRADVPAAPDNPPAQNAQPVPNVPPAAQQASGRPTDALGIGPRLALLDADGHRLAGSTADNSTGAVRPILYNGAVVGKLTLQAAPTSVKALDDAFLASQTQNMALAGAAALALSLLAAWALARHLLAPIRELARGAHKIADGWLDARIEVRRDDELGELGASFNDMAERLARLEESRRAWISETSHELRTPLAVLRAEIEALQDGVRTPDAATLARLHKQVQQLAKLVDDLRLTLDRTPGGADMEHELLAPLAIVDEVVAAFRERYAAAGLAIDTAGLVDAGWQVRGDAGRLTQVFANLVENSLRYTNAGGRLRIAAHADGRHLVLQFDDTAPAPPVAALPRLFERFFRAEPSRSRAHGGSGLGLAICKTLIEAHGGCIAAVLSPLGGLAIRIDLPLAATA